MTQRSFRESLGFRKGVFSSHTFIFVGVSVKTSQAKSGWGKDQVKIHFSRKSYGFAGPLSEQKEEPRFRPNPARLHH